MTKKFKKLEFLRDLEMPKKLLHRDANNKLDVQVALEIIQRVAQIYITKDVMKELASFGIKRNSDILKGIPILNLPMLDTDTLVVAKSYTLGYPLTLPNNKVVTCKHCREFLEVGSTQYIEGAVFLCCFCAADGVLEYYWQQQAEKSSKPKSRSKSK